MPGIPFCPFTSSKCSSGKIKFLRRIKSDTSYVCPTGQNTMLFKNDQLFLFYEKWFACKNTTPSGQLPFLFARHVTKALSQWTEKETIYVFMNSALLSKLNHSLIKRNRKGYVLVNQLPEVIGEFRNTKGCMFYFAEARMLLFYHDLTDMSYEGKLTIVCSTAVAAFKPRVEAFFCLMILFYLKSSPLFYVKTPTLSHATIQVF